MAIGRAVVIKFWGSQDPNFIMTLGTLYENRDPIRRKMLEVGGGISNCAQIFMTTPTCCYHKFLGKKYEL